MVIVDLTDEQQIFRQRWCGQKVLIYKTTTKHLCVDFTLCSNQEVHIHVKVLNKVNTFYMLTIQRFSIECKDYVRN